MTLIIFLIPVRFCGLLKSSIIFSHFKNRPVNVKFSLFFSTVSSFFRTACAIVTLLTPILTTSYLILFGWIHNRQTSCSHWDLMARPVCCSCIFGENLTISSLQVKICFYKFNSTLSCNLSLFRSVNLQTELFPHLSFRDEMKRWFSLCTSGRSHSNCVASNLLLRHLVFTVSASADTTLLPSEALYLRTPAQYC